MVIFHSYVKLPDGTTTTKLHYTALHCAAVRCTTLPYTRPQCTTLITPHYATTTALHFADRDCTPYHPTLHNTTVYYNRLLYTTHHNYSSNPNCDCPTQIIQHDNNNLQLQLRYTTLQLQRQLQYTTLHAAVVVR